MRERVQKKRAMALERARKEEMVIRLHEDRRIREEVVQPDNRLRYVALSAVDLDFCLRVVSYKTARSRYPHPPQYTKHILSLDVPEKKRQTQFNPPI